MCNILGNEIVSQINKNKTVLKQLNAIKDYIKKYPQTRVFFAKQSYSTNATRITFSNIYLPSEMAICEGDIIIDTQFKVFRVTATTATEIYVSYYNTITGPQGPQGPQGPKGETGEQGETPLIYTDFIYDEEYGGTTSDEPFYIDNNKFNRTPKINETFYMFVYASKEFNNVVIQVFTVLEVDTSRTKVQLINGVQIPQQYNIKGEWVENGRYYVNDWVTYGNGVYLCIKNIANSATIPPLDKTNFEFIGGEKSISKTFSYTSTLNIEIPFTGNKQEIMIIHGSLAPIATQYYNLKLYNGDDVVRDIEIVGNSVFYIYNISADYIYFVTLTRVEEPTNIIATTMPSKPISKMTISGFETGKALIKIKEYFE